MQNTIWTTEPEDEIDLQFFQRIQQEVTQTCALPMAIPIERIPEIVRQAAQWFWAHVDQAVEERYYVIPNSEICKGNKINKVVQLPQQIYGVFGVHKVQEQLKYGAMGDFSMERMLMSSYNVFGGSGGGTVSTTGRGWSLPDAIATLYEIDTFNQFLNPPVTYNFNQNSSKLVILGNLGFSDILIQTWVRCRIQDLYNDYYFFRLCVVFMKRSLSVIYGTYEFKLPGGVTINYDNFSSQADSEYDEIKEWADNNNVASYFFMPGEV